jgi:hypothetical protein
MSVRSDFNSTQKALSSPSIWVGLLHQENAIATQVIKPTPSIHVAIPDMGTEFPLGCDRHPDAALLSRKLSPSAGSAQSSRELPDIPTVHNSCRFGLREWTRAEHCAASAAKRAVDLHGQKRASCGTKIPIVQVISSRTPHPHAANRCDDDRSDRMTYLICARLSFG